MTVRRIVPDIKSKYLDDSRVFYVDFLGLKVAMDLGWVVTFVSPSNPTAQISVHARRQSFNTVAEYVHRGRRR